jgi:hypothetical protein
LEIGVKLIERRARGIALTPAGRVFLDHARLVPSLCFCYGRDGAGDYRR